MSVCFVAGGDLVVSCSSFLLRSTSKPNENVLGGGGIALTEDFGDVLGDGGLGAGVLNQLFIWLLSSYAFSSARMP